MAEAAITPRELEQQAMTWPERAQALRIDNDEALMQADEMLLGIKDLEKEIMAHHGPIKRKAHEAWKAVVAAEKRMLEPLRQAEAVIKERTRDYRLKRQREADEAGRKAEKEARRRAEEQALRAAIEAEKEGAAAGEVEAILREAERQPLPVPKPPEPPKTKGISTVTAYRAEVADLKALAGGVVEGTVPPAFIEPNMKALNQWARATKGSAELPGVRVIAEQVVRAGRR